MDFETYLDQPLEFDKDISRYFGDEEPLTIFEIGACEGEDTIKLRKRFPKADIYAFEALPKNVRRMKKNYTKYSAYGINTQEVALSNNNGVEKLHISSGHPTNLPRIKGWDYGNKSSSLLPPKEHKKIHKWMKFDQQINVRTMRIDTFCGSQSIKKIDFIYMDVQGAELKVLQGAGSIIKHIGIIWMEVEAIELYENQPLKAEVETFMKKSGFVKITDTVGDVSGDQLYVNSRLTNKKQRLKDKLTRSLARK